MFQVSLKAAEVWGRDVSRNDGQAECPALWMWQRKKKNWDWRLEVKTVAVWLITRGKINK